MSAAVASLLALLAAIGLSMTTRINVGLVAMALAWIVGRYVAGLGADVIVRGFPTPLFLALTGVTLLFASAEVNGTLERLAERAVRLARGSARIVPLVFFAIACLVSAVGPGSVSTVALLAPFAMAAAARVGVPAFLMAIMVANGANAGNLSPVSAVGVIANSKIAEAGLGNHWLKVMLANLVASAAVAAAGYFLLRGHRLASNSASAADARAVPVFTGAQWLTLAVAVVWVASVVAFKLNLTDLGLSAMAGALVLTLTRSVDESQAIKRMPWSVILMVTGVTVLIGVLETTGGLALFTDALAWLATPAIVNGVVALVTGVISIYSSTSGVVLPTFLPTVPGLVARLGGGDPLAVALSINVGASLVDVSPLSTLGALCLAAAVVDAKEAQALFRRLMLWGIAMAAVGALLCQAFAGWLARM
ncbi:MAG: SLC13 family permease [Acidobacteriota bacterium]